VTGKERTPKQKMPKTAAYIALATAITAGLSGGSGAYFGAGGLPERVDKVEVRSVANEKVLTRGELLFNALSLKVDKIERKQEELSEIKTALALLKDGLKRVEEALRR